MLTFECLYVFVCAFFKRFTLQPLCQTWTTIKRQPHSLDFYHYIVLILSVSHCGSCNEIKSKLPAAKCVNEIQTGNPPILSAIHSPLYHSPRKYIENEKNFYAMTTVSRWLLFPINNFLNQIIRVIFMKSNLQSQIILVNYVGFIVLVTYFNIFKLHSVLEPGIRSVHFFLNSLDICISANLYRSISIYINLAPAFFISWFLTPLWTIYFSLKFRI